MSAWWWLLIGFGVVFVMTLALFAIACYIVSAADQDES